MTTATLPTKKNLGTQPQKASPAVIVGSIGRSWETLTKVYKSEFPVATDDAERPQPLVSTIGEYAIMLNGDEYGQLASVTSIRHGSEKHAYTFNPRTNGVEANSANINHPHIALFNAAVMSGFAGVEWHIEPSVAA